jgi:hypothetical protein
MVASGIGAMANVQEATATKTSTERLMSLSSNTTAFTAARKPTTLRRLIKAFGSFQKSTTTGKPTT